MRLLRESDWHKIRQLVKCAMGRVLVSHAAYCAPVIVVSDENELAFLKTQRPAAAHMINVSERLVRCDADGECAKICGVRFLAGALGALERR